MGKSEPETHGFYMFLPWNIGQTSVDFPEKNQSNVTRNLRVHRLEKWDFTMDWTDFTTRDFFRKWVKHWGETTWDPWSHPSHGHWVMMVFCLAESSPFWRSQHFVILSVGELSMELSTGWWWLEPLEPWNLFYDYPMTNCPSYWEFHDPNWRTQFELIFFRGVGQPPTRLLIIINNH